MGAGQSVHTINLHEPKVIDHRLQVVALARPAARPKQKMAVQKQAAGGLVVDDDGAHARLSMD